MRCGAWIWVRKLIELLDDGERVEVEGGRLDGGGMCNTLHISLPSLRAHYLGDRELAVVVFLTSWSLGILLIGKGPVSGAKITMRGSFLNGKSPQPFPPPPQKKKKKKKKKIEADVLRWKPSPTSEQIMLNQERACCGSHAPGSMFSLVFMYSIYICCFLEADPSERERERRQLS